MEAHARVDGITLHLEMPEFRLDVAAVFQRLEE
jgi:hypothetical protein